jgi:hypothetical protein
VSTADNPPETDYSLMSLEELDRLADELDQRRNGIIDQPYSRAEAIAVAGARRAKIEETEAIAKAGVPRLKPREAKILQGLLQDPERLQAVRAAESRRVQQVRVGTAESPARGQDVTTVGKPVSPSKPAG